MVNRCICHNVPFATIAAMARDGVPLPEVSRRTGCCTGCNLCRPYVFVAYTHQASVVRLLNPREVVHINTLIGDQLPGGDQRGKSPDSAV